jgi:SagB-type dehydrogenase family enzyme
MSYGDAYQRLSKYRRNDLKGKKLDWENRPELYKEYPPHLERLMLNKPQTTGGKALYNLLLERRSHRHFLNNNVQAEHLSQVLWAIQGITLKTEHHQFRASPSAGALYPVETYCVINRVEGFKPGVYYFQIPNHSLILLKKGSYGQELASAALGQTMMKDAAFNLVWSAVIERSKWKYDQRAYRYIYLDAGHIAQNAALAALSCGLSSCQVGAFFDSEVDSILNLDGEKEFSIYMTAIGTPAKYR